MKNKGYSLNCKVLTVILPLILFLESCEYKAYLAPSINKNKLSNSTILDGQSYTMEQVAIIPTNNTTELLQGVVSNPNIQQQAYAYISNEGVDEIPKETLELAKQEEPYISDNQAAEAKNIPPSVIFELLSNHNNEEQQDKPLGSLDILPTEILELILLYMTAEDIMTIRKVNKAFYQLTTGYDQPGLIGLEHKPLHSVNLEVCAINKKLNLQKFSPHTFCSFAFYQFIRQISNFPKEFWPYLPESNIHTIRLCDNPNTPLGKEPVLEFVKYLKGSKVHTLSLTSNDIGPEGACQVGKCLQGTQIHTLNLDWNQIGPEGVDAFSKNLQGTHVHTLHLYKNHIGAKGAGKLAKNLQGTLVHTLYLGDNQLEAKGAAKFAKYLPGTNIHTLNLNSNQIKDEGVSKLAKYLQGSQVHTIHLSSNNIQGNDSFGEFGLNLQGTLVHTINLRYNKIQAKGAVEFAEYLKGTNVRIIDLYQNQIGSEGAANFAQNLQGSQVEEVNLNFNNINGRTIYLLKSKYPHIKWVNW